MAKSFSVKIDSTGFTKLIDEIASKVDNISMQALEEMGDTLLNLSSAEVPHDEGTLQSSGSVVPGDNEVEVGYHTPYAARLHEHPEYNFQGGRKGKYLEDPLKHNLSKWLDIFGKEMGALL
jgi:hypothetical protein